MAIDFPKDRPEAGLGSGPLQNGDVWTNKSIEYTWVVTPSGVGVWSSRGINVDPEVFIAKVDQFGGDVSGTYDNLTVSSADNADLADRAKLADKATNADRAKLADKATNADRAALADNAGAAITAGVADKVDNKLTLRFVDDVGAVTETTYDGSEAKTFTFTDTNDATQVIQLNGGTGIDIEPNNTIAIKDGVARRVGPADFYILDGDGNYLKVKQADRANQATTADTATSADTAITATSADTANTASNANFAISADNANNANKLNGYGYSHFATKDDLDDIPGGVGTQDLQSVLDEGAEARLTGNDRMKLTHDNGEMFMRPDKQWFVARSRTGQSATYKPGIIELKNDPPFIDFKRTVSDDDVDFETRIIQMGTDLVISTPFGELYHQDSSGAYHKIGSGGDGGGGGTVIAGVSNVSKSSQTINPISVSPTTGDVVIGWNGLTTGQLTDVNTTGVRNGQVLAWNSNVSQWRPADNAGTIVGGGDSHSFGVSKLIDKLAIDDGQDPDSVDNWTTYLQQAATAGGNWVFPERVYRFDATIEFNGGNAVWSGLSQGQRPNFRWIGGVPNLLTGAVGRCAIWCRSKVRFYGIRFETDGLATTQALTNSAFLLFQRTLADNENDTDGSVENCNFSIIRSERDNPLAACIVYLGRNLRCANNVFSSGNPNSKDENYTGTKHIRCISLSYGLNANGDGDGQNLESGGYRKTIIRDNTFHLRKNAEAILCFRVSGTGVGQHYGLNVTGNTIDVGGSLLRVTQGHQLNGAVISGNACYRSHQQPYILMEGGAMRNCAITGNTFIGGNSEMPDSANAEAYSNCIEILGSSDFNRNTITGNTFARPETACINFETTVNNVIITGNTFDQDNRTANAINLDRGTGVISSNASNCNVFTSGNLGNFIKANNVE